MDNAVDHGFSDVRLKTLRGTCDDTGQGGVRLLAAMTHDSGIVVAQQEVDGKTNEITCFRPLLSTMDMAGIVVTTDAPHTQRGGQERVVPPVDPGAHVPGR